MHARGKARAQRFVNLTGEQHFHARFQAIFLLISFRAGSISLRLDTLAEKRYRA